MIPRPFAFALVLMTVIGGRPLIGHSPAVDVQNNQTNVNTRQTAPAVNSSASSDVSPNNPQIDLAPWANAKPYLDDDLPKLLASVPELKGLDRASSQEQLTSILDLAGEKCVDLLRRVPNVIAREEVVSLLPKAPRAGFSLTPHTGIERENFDYLLLSEQTPNGTALREYRMVDGRPATAPLGMGQLSEGFTSEWLHLHPANRSQARFRYLGQGMMDKHQTFVVAFAQIPQMVQSPPSFQLSGDAVAIFVQGIVWVDSTDFRIVRMREDLLAPRPDVGLKKFTTTIRFGEVNIAKAASSLWLPQEVVIDWEFQGETVQRRHRYSKYRLYGATTKILPAAP